MSGEPDDYRLDEDFQDFDEALEDLLETAEQIEDEAKIQGDEKAEERVYAVRRDIEELKDSYSDIEQEIRLSREWIDEVRQAEQHFFPRYLDTIDSTLQNLEQVSESLNSGPVVYEERDRRSFTKWLALLLGGFGVAFAANELSDEYDVDINPGYLIGFENDEGGGIGGDEGQGSNFETVGGQNNAGPSEALEIGEYDMVVTDDGIISDIGDEYRSYSGAIGQLGAKIRDAYMLADYQDLTLGYHDGTQHVQMTDLADELLVNFGLEEQETYEEAKIQARSTTS